MKINKIIKERRTAQGLTQEQVAEYIGVSTPAVNKWEKGSSYPDITILPSLARLLKVDLNTLLCFKEDLSEQEIGNFTNELVQIISTEGFDIAFEKAMDKLHEYPTCNKLSITVASVLQGGLYMFAVENKEKYEGNIEKIYVKVSESDDFEMKNRAISMLINKHLQREEYEKAGAYINKLPDVTYDKNLLKGNLYNKSGELDKAYEIFEGKIMNSANDIVISLMSMMEIALKEENIERAKYFAQVLEKTTKLYDLWDYNAYIAYFQLYSEQKDKENFISNLKKMLASMNSKWDITKSNLYKHIKVKESELDNKKLFSPFINSLKDDKNKELDFIRDDEEFNKLIKDNL